MKKIKNNNVIGFFVLGVATGLVLLVGVARMTWHTKFYPGVQIASIPVAGLTREQAKSLITEKTDKYSAELSFNGSTWYTTPQSVTYEIDSTINEAYTYGRRMQIQDYLLLVTGNKTNYPLKLAMGKTDKLELLIQDIASSIEISPIEPTVDLEKGKIVINNGSDGTIIDSEQLDQKIHTNFSELSPQKIEIPTKVVKRSMRSDELALLKTRAESLVGKNVKLSLDDEKIQLNDKELISFLSTVVSGEALDTTKIEEYINGLSQSLNKAPQDAKFEFNDGKVNEFLPGKDGVEVNTQLTAEVLGQSIKKLLETESRGENIEIAVTRTAPKVTTEKVNELGIRERIGRGESYYAHSIPNRIYNVALASERINSALVPPGEEVSFNRMVGEVSAATGYRQAYIIEKGRTVLGDGGGLCQVSTTLFRAAMNAGLPILERWGHAYRVSYYELNSKPGVDATVIAPSKDFRFRNDTPGHILIQAINDPKALHLVIEIYGTSDGRVATATEPKVWGITPPLPTIYQDDPTLATGTMKQVDWAASGAKASFEYKVTRNGEMIHEKTFTTIYRPWASVYMRGTGQ